MDRISTWTAGFAGLALAAVSIPAGAQSLDELARTAAGQGPVIWYESSPEDQIAQVIDVFNEAYPDIEVEYIRITGGNTIAARVIQEVEGRAETASLVSGGSSHITALHDRGLLHTMDWSTIGIPEIMTPTDFTVATAASVYVSLWNTNAVADEDAPRSWDAFLEPEWQGRVGSWVRSAGYAMLAYEWGEERAEDWVRRFAAQRPMLYQSTFPLAQQVAAGEIDAAIGIYHAAQPPIRAGAPIGMAALDPTPMNTIWTSIVAEGGNVEGAMVLLAWLVSEEGAAAYEDATSRGSALISSTGTAQMLGGRTLSEFPLDQQDVYGALEQAFNEILAASGTAAN